MRAIVMFPELPAAALDAIQAVRRDYDPLAELIPPHLTLVFPFTSPLPAQSLEAHIRAAGQGSIELALGQVTGGPLADHLDPRFTYTPHLTVGRIADPGAFASALTDASARLPGRVETTLRTISVYCIAAHGERTIESTVTL